MVTMGLWDDPTCPCCHLERETTYHLPLCPHPDIEEAFYNGVNKLKTRLKQLDTSPILLNEILSYLHGKGNSTFMAGLDEPHDIEHDLSSQDVIGWHHFLEGKVATSLMHYQAEFYSGISSRRSATRWAACLSKHLLSIVHSLWHMRNSFVHPKSKNGLSLNDYTKLHKEIRQQLSLNTHGLPADDHYLLNESWCSLLDMPVQERQAWLCTIKLARADIHSSQPSRSRPKRRRSLSNDPVSSRKQSCRHSTSSLTGMNK